jgi:hypothetical protein
MANVGRISGPLLKANLERKGIDLAFETDLLYLDVQCRSVGIGKKVICSPTTAELEVVDSGIKTTDLISDQDVTVDELTFDNAGIISSTANSAIVFESPLGVSVPRLINDNLEFDLNNINATTANTSIDITATGRTNFGADTRVTGNVFINGNALYYTATIEEALTQEEVGNLIADLRPAENNAGSVGNVDFKWDESYFSSVESLNIVLPLLGFDTVPVTHPGNIFYVSSTGIDTNFGTVLTSPFRTIRKALSVATAGTTVVITTGEYLEEFPLTVPAGVTITGQSIRAVTIKPTEATVTNDAFLLNGETTIEDLTVSGFRFDAVNNTGYAFRFANDITVTTKSPYIRNVSVITKGSNVTLTDPLSYDTHDAGRGAYIDGSVANATSIQASMLFYGVTFITPGVDAIVMTNGVRVEAIDCFTYFANRGFYATQGLIGFTSSNGAVPGTIEVGPAPTGVSLTSDSVTLSKTFYSQSLVDSLVGQTAVIDIYPNPPLIYTVVSIETEPLSPTEWRMTVDTTFNLAGQLKPISFYPDAGAIQIITNDIWDTTGNSIGEKWVAWFKTNLPVNFNTTVGPNWTINVAGTIYIVDYVIEDPVNTNMWRIYVTTSLVAGVGIPIFSSPGIGTITRFGAEIRSISCANVYGKYGVVGNGSDVIAYLIGHNFAYIGTGKDSSNDGSLRVQANEVVESNNAKILFNSTDQGGDFRVGNDFLVNFKTGATSFTGETFDLSGISTLTITSEAGVTVVASYKIDSNNFRFSGSTIETITGNINFESASGLFLLDNNVNVGKNLSVTGNVDFKGTITLGNQTSDTVSFAMKLNQDIVPDTNNLYSLGSVARKWNQAYINAVNLPNLTIDNNTITALSGNLNFVGNGTAGVNVDQLRFTNNILSTNTNVNLKLKPSSSNVVYIDSIESLRLPSGTASDRPFMNAGEIRYDTASNVFSAQSTFRTTLGGVYSTNRNTRVVTDSNNKITFIVNNSESAAITTNSVQTIGLLVNKIRANTNTIFTVGSDDLLLTASGSGSVFFNNIKFDGDNIINTTNNGVLLPAGTSYVKLAAITAMTIPVHELEAPVSMQIGTLRYNPSLEIVQVWDGDSFDNIGGVGGNATEDDIEQLTNLWTLILG